MATGIPRKSSGGPRQRDSLSIALTYLGKRAEEAILASPAGDYETVWSSSPRSGNRLIFGDNLRALAALLGDRSVAGKVRLVYIDPPYATESVFHSRSQDHAYDDVTAGPEYLEALRGRLVFLRELLAEDGSIYLHLDEKMAFHAKLVLDEVFGPQNYRNCITRKKCNPKNYTRKTYGNVADYILFYTKSDGYVWNRPTLPWTPERAKEYQYVEPGTGRRFMKVPVHAPGVRNGETGLPWRGKLPPPGKHWQYPPRVLDELDARGEIYWSPNGNPRRKVYLDSREGIGVQDIWLDFRDAHNQNIRITGYPTEKNPDLLRRIVEASSNPGDLVLDCYSGSGTTLASANHLGRQWIGIDNSPVAITTTIERFLVGPKLMGDYVANAKDSRTGDLATPSLFAASADSPEANGSPSVPGLVKDFTLLADQSLAQSHRDCLKSWLQQLAESVG